jgi:hypothetical protein
MTERETPQIFDAIFKKLMMLSNRAVICLINGLFNASHPVDSAIEYPTTEYISDDLKRQMLDILILIDSANLYHIEAQIDDDKNMVVRMFNYGLAVGFRNKGVSDDVIHIKFPEHKVIYWETTKASPDHITLKLELPDTTVEYRLRSMKFLDYSIRHLEDQGLVVLIPFHLLKLRKQIESAKTSEQRTVLAGQMNEIVRELALAVRRSEMSGFITNDDAAVILGLTDRLFKELYRDRYKEFKEAEDMLQGALRTQMDVMREEMQSKEQAWQNKERQAIQTLAKSNVGVDVIAKALNMTVDEVSEIVGAKSSKGD